MQDKDKGVKGKELEHSVRARNEFTKRVRTSTWGQKLPTVRCRQEVTGMAHCMQGSAANSSMPERAAQALRYLIIHD